MKIIWKHIWRNICENKLRSIIVIMSLTLTAAVFYLNIGIRRDVLDIYTALVENEYAGYDLSVTKDGGGLFFVDEIDGEMLDSTRSTTAQVFEAQASFGTERMAASVIAVHVPRAAYDGLIHVTEGTPKSGGVILSEQQASYYRVGVGDTFRLYTDEESIDLSICALCDSAGVLNLGTNSLTVIADYYAFSEKATAENMADAMRLINGEQAGVLLFDLPKGTDFDEACAAFSEKNDGFTATNLHGSMNSFVLIDKISMVLTIILFVVTVLCYYVASSVSSLLLQMRLSVIGTFRSVGASRSQANMILLSENLLVGLIAGVVGLVPGEILRIVLLEYYMPQGGYMPARPSFMLLTVAFSVALQAVISLPAIVKAGRRSIRDNIFHKLTVRSELSRPAALAGALCLAVSVTCYLLNKSYQTVPAILAFVLGVAGMVLLAPLFTALFSRVFTPLCQRVFKAPFALGVKRMHIGQTNQMSVVLVAVVTAMILVISFCVSSLDAYFDGWVARFDRDIFIREASGPAENYEFLKDGESVREVFFQRRAKRNITVNGKEARIYFTSRGGFDGGIEVDESTLAGLSDGFTIVDEMWAERNGLSAGDELTVVNSRSGEESTAAQEFSLTIAGFCNSSLFNNKRTTWILTEHDYVNFIGASAELIGVTLTDHADAKAVSKEIYADILRRTGEPALVLLRDEYFSDEMALGYDALSIISAVPVLAVLLSVIGLVNNLIMSFDQKRREYAVLYSVAMSRRQLAVLTAAEPIGIFFSGVMIGGAFSLYFGPVMSDLIYSIILRIDPVIDPLWFSLILAAVFVSVCLTCVVPLRMIRRMDIVSEVKYE